MLRGLFAALFFGASQFGAVFAQSPTRERLADSVREWRVAIQEKFFVEYTVTRQFVGKAEVYAPSHVGDSGEMKAGGASSLLPTWAARHAWKRSDGRFYHATFLRTSDDPGELLGAVVSDGDLLYRISPEAKQASVTRNFTAQDLPQAMTPEEELYREILGFASRRQGWGVTLADARSASNPDLMECLESSAYQVIAREPGTGLVVVKNPGVDRIVLDTNVGYAIRQREFYWSQTGKLRTRFEVKDFRELGNGVWVPESVRIVHFAIDGNEQPVVEANLVLGAASLHAPSSLFELPVDRLRSLFDNDRATLVKLEPLEGRSVREFLDDVARADAARPGFVVPIVIVLCNVLLIFLVLLIWKRRKQAA